MPESAIAIVLRPLIRALDPRRSLVAGAIWLIIGLAATFSIAAGVWVGSIARENVLEQHVRRLSLETDQLSTDLDQAIAVRLDAIRAAGRILQATRGSDRPGGLNDVFRELAAVYPQLDWIAAADPDGVVRSTNGQLAGGSEVASSPWFAAGMRGPWLGIIAAGPGRPAGAAETAPTSSASDTASLGDLAAPVRDDEGRVVGVIAARLSWRRAPHHPLRLTDESDPHGVTQAYVLDREDIVLVGPDGTRGQRWSAIPIEGVDLPVPGGAEPRFERLPDGRPVLVSRAPLSAGDAVASLGWRVQLCEPRERVYQRANALALKILWVSICLCAATCLLGMLGARKLTLRLKRLTRSVAAVGANASEQIEIPGGADEVAMLAQAFAKILGDLQRERRELQILSNELERRVAVRTREVERLAEDSRYAAIVRERLKIARDLHDTLAHSMMAMLSEIRYLRRLQARDPAAVADELARAEAVAHEGLKEARTAITQMRVNAVRETGLGPALSRDFERFVNRTGLTGELDVDVESARFGDERAETLLRMAQEALRNVERHSMATRVLVTLRTLGDTRLELSIEDNGVGFDPESPHPQHYGIVGLREQADLIGAELRIESGPNRGTKVTIALPLAPVAFDQASTS
jgi:signal transduction histidine kinase